MLPGLTILHSQVSQRVISSSSFGKPRVLRTSGIGTAIAIRDSHEWRFLMSDRGSNLHISHSCVGALEEQRGIGGHYQRAGNGGIARGAHNMTSYAGFCPATARTRA